jgi:hypothetical protein
MSSTAKTPPTSSAVPPVPNPNSASGQEPTSADRLAFQVWSVFALLIVAFTLVMYLINWLR